MSIIRKIGLALVGAEYIAQLENTAARQVLASATPEIKASGVAALTERQGLRVFLDRIFGEAVVINLLTRTSNLKREEKNVIKLKSSVTKLVAETRSDLTNRELSLVAEALIGIVSIDVFTPNTKA